MAIGPFEIRLIEQRKPSNFSEKSDFSFDAFPFKTCHWKTPSNPYAILVMTVGFLHLAGITPFNFKRLSSNFLEEWRTIRKEGESHWIQIVSDKIQLEIELY